MNAIEFIEQIKKLPCEEQDEVYSFVEAESRKRTTAGPARYASDADFEKAADMVFRENDNLFQWLAQ